MADVYWLLSHLITIICKIKNLDIDEMSKEKNVADRVNV